MKVAIIHSPILALFSFQLKVLHCAQPLRMKELGPDNPEKKFFPLSNSRGLSLAEVIRKRNRNDIPSVGVFTSRKDVLQMQAFDPFKS